MRDHPSNSLRRSLPVIAVQFLRRCRQLVGGVLSTLNRYGPRFGLLARRTAASYSEYRSNKEPVAS